MVISIGSDHHGVLIRMKLCDMVRQLGHEVRDHGPTADDTQAVDYPDIAAAVAQEISTGQAERGILICGTGLGMCIAANKFPGVRAAPVTDELTAEMSRRHNDLNVLCLSGDMLSEKMIDHLVEIWIATAFEGGRHARRIDKIINIENTGIAYS